MPILHIVLDIEGTITAINFVHEVLFPLSYDKIENFVHDKENFPLIKEDLSSLAKQNNIEEDDLASIVTLLKQFIKKDIKDTHLKTIQGHIWKRAFESGEIKGHLYPDAHEFIVNSKTPLNIYSSGSVNAQIQLLKYSQFGDLTPYIQKYFDTNIGGKKQSQSYQNIAQQLNIKTEQMLFVSDAIEEIDAAQDAGCRAVLIRRREENLPMPPQSSKENQYQIIENFHQLPELLS